MKKYNDVVTVDGYDEGLLICELTAEDVAKAENEFSLYMRCKGETYKRDSNKCPTVRNFFKLYFGEDESDAYGECWITPNRYICTNKNIADRLMKLAKQLAFHDSYNQVYCDVEQNGKIVDVGYGDY